MWHQQHHLHTSTLSTHATPVQGDKLKGLNNKYQFRREQNYNTATTHHHSFDSPDNPSPGSNPTTPPLTNPLPLYPPFTNLSFRMIHLPCIPTQQPLSHTSCLLYNQPTGCLLGSIILRQCWRAPPYHITVDNYPQQEQTTRLCSTAPCLPDTQRNALPPQ